MHVLRDIETHSHNQCCRGRPIRITNSECVCVSVVLDIQHAQRMRSIILLSVGCAALPWLSMMSHKRHDFGTRKLLNMIPVLIFSTSFD
jgi:hypothetical protein